MTHLRQAWLHSSHPQSRWNFVAGECDGSASFDAGLNRGRASCNGSTFESQDPFELLDWVADHPREGWRWIGYISYGLARFIERLPRQAVDDLRLPLFAFARFRSNVPTSDDDLATPAPVSRVVPTISAVDYQKGVTRALAYIAAGDVFQVNLAQRLDVHTDRSPAAIWHQLRERYPCEFGALLDCGSFSIISNSPELFFRIEVRADGSRRIVNRPIKGTRPVLPGMFDELVKSKKDIAELAMIVDLQRNDLGRVCEIGSVRVIRAREIETHPTVFHGVATIEGMLRERATLSEIIRAMFPCGSITGCPKIRAMEIIDELEPFERGPYCGAIGYLDPDGSMEFNVAIRTMSIKDGCAYVNVGGGIVADSTPAGEYDETLVKATAMLDALGVDISTFK